MWVRLVVFYSLLTTTHGVSEDTPLVHYAVLDADNKFHLSWDFDNSSIIFEAQVETTGYVGLGFSPNGGMPDSDIVIGWVDDNTGKGQISDRYATGKSEPVVDDHQDYVLLSSSQNVTHTVLRFKRPLNPCDGKDRSVESETVRVIWAIGDTDPGSTVAYHGDKRGSKNIFLLNPQKAIPDMPNTVITETFLNPEVPIPAEHTTYWCQAFAVPKLSSKHHVIKFEPIVQRGHESEVHHILLYACYHDVQNETVGKGHECYNRNMPTDFWDCTSVVYSWAVGGGELYLPENVGIPFGYDGDPTMLLMETHYDNPSLKSGLVDSSGVRMTLTSDLRRHDAGVLMIGEEVDYTQVVPPHSKMFRTAGHCLPGCLNEAMADAPQGVSAFAGLLHSHLAGRAMRLRHFRNGTELPTLLKDENYDFNFQETRMLSNEVKILPGDHFITECDYNTEDAENVTFGGLSTRDEMCLGFVLYYPKIKLGSCQSAPTKEYLAKFLGVTLNGNDVATSPPSYSGQYIYNILKDLPHWTNQTVREGFQQWILKEDEVGFEATCTEGNHRYAINSEVLDLPKILSTYREKENCTSIEPTATSPATIPDKTDITTPSKGSLILIHESLLVLPICVYLIKHYVD